MQDKYLIFDKGYNKILDLLEEADLEVASMHEKVVNNMPINVFNQIRELEDFTKQTSTHNTEMIMLGNRIDLDFTRYQNFINAQMEVHRIFEQHVFPKVDKKGNFIQEEPIVLYKLEIRNTPRKQPDLNVYFEEQNGKFVYVGSNNTDNNIIDLCYIVSLEKIAGNFFLVSTKTARGWEIYTKRSEIAFDEVIDRVEDEDDYEEDAVDAEFEADFDI